MGYKKSKNLLGKNKGGKVKSGHTVPHSETVRIWLQRPGMAEEFLNSILEDGNEDPCVLLLALRDIVDAFGGIGKLALKTKLNRENLYRMLSPNGNPEIHSLQVVLDALGLQLAVRSKPQLKRAA